MPDTSLPIIDRACRLVLEVDRVVGHQFADLDEVAALANDRASGFSRPQPRRRALPQGQAGLRAGQQA